MPIGSVRNTHRMPNLPFGLGYSHTCTCVCPLRLDNTRKAARSRLRAFRRRYGIGKRKDPRLNGGGCRESVPQAQADGRQACKASAAKCSDGSGASFSRLSNDRRRAKLGEEADPLQSEFKTCQAFVLFRSPSTRGNRTRCDPSRYLCVSQGRPADRTGTTL